MLSGPFRRLPQSCSFRLFGPSLAQACTSSLGIASVQILLEQPKRCFVLQRGKPLLFFSKSLCVLSATFILAKNFRVLDAKSRLKSANLS